MEITTLLVYFAAIIEKADEQVLPAVYLFAGTSWKATPVQLGQITLCRALVQALASPLSGVFSDWYSRIWVIAAGCVIWGVMTSAIAAAQTVHQAMLYAALNGFGLSLVIPCSQSLIADFHVAAVRGRAFGLMQLISATGVVGGALFATNVGHYSPLGMDGWRFALHVVAAISIFTGVLVWRYGRDPRYDKTKSAHPKSDLEAAPLFDADGHKSSFWQDTMRILRIPSFGIIILQGVIGTMPWSAMVFFTLWFQLLGFSDFVASVLRSTFNIGCAFGGVIGGFVADYLAAAYPDSGRTMAAQISCMSGFPLFLILFKVLPMLEMTHKALMFGCVLLSIGLLFSWCGSGCNAPMFSELVPETLYSKIFAFDRSFEGSVASMAAPLVGYVAHHHFGFTGAVGEDKMHQHSNAVALGNSLFACITIPAMFCCLSYTGLYWTFPKDRKKARTKQ